MAYRERVGRDAESCDAWNNRVLHGGVVQHVSKGGDDTDTQLLGGGEGRDGREGGRERRQTIKQNPQTKKKTFPRRRKRKSL